MDVFALNLGRPDRFPLSSLLLGSLLLIGNFTSSRRQEINPDLFHLVVNGVSANLFWDTFVLWVSIGQVARSQVRSTKWTVLFVLSTGHRLECHLSSPSPTLKMCHFNGPEATTSGEAIYSSGNKQTSSLIPPSQRHDASTFKTTSNNWSLPVLMTNIIRNLIIKHPFFHSGFLKFKKGTSPGKPTIYNQTNIRFHYRFW